MGKTVILAEKKQQAEKLAAPFKHEFKNGYIIIKPCSLFKEGAYVTWCIGSMFEIKKPGDIDRKWKAWKLESLPIIPERFEYQLIKGKEKQFQTIQRLLKKSDVSNIIIGTDPARQGSLIGIMTIRMTGVKKPTKRLWAKSLTKQAVLKAFQNLYPEQKAILGFNEAQAREKADYVVGMSTTRVYSLLLQDTQKKQGQFDVYSTGRVQTPVLSLIYKREKAIESFQPQPFYEIEAEFKVDGQLYKGKWFNENTDRLFNQNQAKSLADYCQGKEAQVFKIQTKRKNLQPPSLYNLSALQLEANNRYHYTSKEVLNIAQQLYEKEYISYPRSESTAVTKEEARMFPGILEQLRQIDAFRATIPKDIPSVIDDKRFVNEEKVSDHYAIIPTDNVPNMKNLSKDEQRIYDLIARSLIAIHHSDHIIDYQTAITVVDDRFAFKTKGKSIVQEGWKYVYRGLDAKQDQEDYEIIPPLQEGMNGITNRTLILNKMTKPPKRYTEGQLIALMKSPDIEDIHDDELQKILKKTGGIGTEATRADISETLRKVGYIKLKNNIVHITDKGKRLIEAVGESVLSSAMLTAQWEKRLREIGEGKANPHEFVEHAKKLATKLVEDAIQRLKYKQSKPTTESRESHSYNSAPASRNKEQKEDSLYTKDESESTTSKASLIPIGSCLLCGGDMIDKGNFYGCANYRHTGCGFTISKVILGKKLSEEDIKSLLKTGNSSLIDGFKHKSNGEQFKAMLSWDREREKLIFKRPNPNIFKLPLHLLQPLNVYAPPKKEVKEDIQAIEKEASSIKMPARVVGTKNGPRITRYELLPKEGINISGYKRYQANFQAALRSSHINMYIPIPGTNKVGIEVPNKFPYPVRLRGLLETDTFKTIQKPLAFPLGMDIYGQPYFADLSEMPHLLVAGASGAGKSVFLNAIIASLLYTNTQKTLQFLFIDPKQVELNVYQGLPHLFMPIITDIKKAGQALNKMVHEMERRYEILQEAGVRNIDSYNKKMAENNQDKLPYICVVIDEVADLIMTSNGSVEDYIVRISQMARAAGIHLIIATQRPTKRVLSPIIKANMPVRVAFSVASSTDSMTILDRTGAEKLLGKGDMIYAPKDQPPQRLQSGFLSDEETLRVVQYIINHHKSEKQRG